MRNTKRQIKETLPRGRELAAVAAELLTYLNATPAENKDSVPPQFPAAAEKAAGALPFQTADAPAGRSAQAAPAFLQAARAEDYDLTDAAAREMNVFPFAADAAETQALPVRFTAGFAAESQQQTMADISEFFRRDSRRYDKGFTGGMGA